MCSEIDQFPSFLRTMSDSRQIFPVDDKEETATVDSLPESETAAVERESENLEDEGDHQKQPEEIKNDDDDDEEEETNKATASHREIEDDDDGFKTPTSSAHRIPSITECPPPPVKPRPPPPSKLKRKASPPQNTSAEVESIFRPIEDDLQQHKIKKSRTDDGEDRS